MPTHHQRADAAALRAMLPAPWQELERADHVKMENGEWVTADDPRASEHGVVWMNDLYIVHVKEVRSLQYEQSDQGDDFPILWLSIRRLDRTTVRDWRHLQWIKNQLAGPEREAIELFPAESRKVDSADQFHLWVFPEGFHFPVGWTTRFVDDQPHEIAPGARNRTLSEPDLRHGGRVTAQELIDKSGLTPDQIKRELRAHD